MAERPQNLIIKNIIIETSPPEEVPPCPFCDGLLEGALGVRRHRFSTVEFVVANYPIYNCTGCGTKELGLASLLGEMRRKQLGYLFLKGNFEEADSVMRELYVGKSIDKVISQN